MFDKSSKLLNKKAFAIAFLQWPIFWKVNITLSFSYQ